MIPDDDKPCVAVALWNAGRSLQQIAQALDTDPLTVGRWIGLDWLPLACVPHDKGRAWRILSDSGYIYYTTADTCTCPAQFGPDCKHRRHVRRLTRGQEADFPRELLARFTA